MRNDRKLRIMMDPQILLRQSYGGVSRYHFEIYKRLLKMGYSVEIPVLLPSNKYFEGYIYKKAYSQLYNNMLFRYMTYILNDLNCFCKIVVSYLLKRKYDIIHTTWYSSFYPFLIKKILGDNSPAFIITVHDMIQELYQNDNKKFKRTAIQKKRMIEFCDYCICVSNKTKEDLIKIYPDARTKVETIYHGYNVTTCLENAALSRKHYILFVGKRDGYKNFEHVCKVMPALKSSNIHCLCIGEEFKKKEKDCFAKLGITEFMHAESVDDDMLNLYYQNAICLVYPSFYEGFGIPILEAFANKCPVILTNYSCFPEIAKDAALYIDGQDVSKTVDAIKVVNDNKEIRKELVTKGRMRLEYFSWEEAANKTLCVYAKALEMKILGHRR